MSAREEGFTIFEALVAFAILTSVLCALYAASGTSLRLIGRSDDLERAAMLARSKLDEIAAIRDPLPPISAGTFPGGDIAWRIEAHDLASPKAGPTPLHLQSVRLILSWPGGRGLALETRHLGSDRHG